MNKKPEGIAFVFGANLDTDQIYPGQYLELTSTDEIRKHAMEGVGPEFVNNFRPGDIIVAGTNFGCGSSREHAAIALKESGVSLILAESFARIFYRNIINLGVPVLECKGILNCISHGDRLTADLTKGIIHNLDSSEVIETKPLFGYILDILENGGIKPLVKKQIRETQEISVFTP